MFLKRLTINRLAKLSKLFPVIAIVGPRQVGKTTLVKEFSKSIKKPILYIDLEKSSDIEKLKEPELFLSELKEKCVIIDEIQRLPEIFPLLRALVDENRIPLRYIILGSASPDLLRNSSESLAGRIAYLKLTPFNYLEIKDNSLMKDHHFRGGFPEAVLSESLETCKIWLNNFIITDIERDLPLLGLSASPIIVRKLWEMLAWQNGNLLNCNSLSKSLGLSNHTVNRYIDFLEGAFIVHRLYPFHYNVKKRLVKTPKIYVRDTGILHRLLRLDNFDQLSGHHLLGASWETYVIEQIMSLKNDDLDLYFYRTHAGAEVDLIFVKGLIPVSCVEIKYTSTPSVSKGMINCINDLKTKKNFIITPQSDDYPAKENIRVCNMEIFLEDYLGNL